MFGRKLCIVTNLTENELCEAEDRVIIYIEGDLLRWRTINPAFCDAVVLDATGDNLSQANEFGRFLRAKGLGVVLLRTEPTGEFICVRRGQKDIDAALYAAACWTRAQQQFSEALIHQRPPVVDDSPAHMGEGYPANYQRSRIESDNTFDPSTR